MKSMLLLLTLFASSAFGQEALRWELQGGTNALFSIGHESGVFGAPDNNTTTTTVSANAGLFLANGLEPRFSIYTSFVGGDTTSSSIVPRIGLVYNLSEDLSNSLYAGASIGIQLLHYANPDRDYSLFTYQIVAGKRFSIVPNVAWAPEVAFTSYSEGSAGSRKIGSSNYVDVIPFKFAVLF